MEEVIRFVLLAQTDRFTVTELCEQFGISRTTGYKHLERYAAEGMPGLQARSHRPHQFPQRTDETVEALVLAERRLHRTWGPKKRHKVLQVKHGIGSPASPATATTSSRARRSPTRRRPFTLRSASATARRRPRCRRSCPPRPSRSPMTSTAT